MISERHLRVDRLPLTEGSEGVFMAEGYFNLRAQWEIVRMGQEASHGFAGDQLNIVQERSAPEFFRLDSPIGIIRAK